MFSTTSVPCTIKLTGSGGRRGAPRRAREDALRVGAGRMDALARGGAVLARERLARGAARAPRPPAGPRPRRAHAAAARRRHRGERK
eukprot:scaffold174812_cov35-Tisochrysis_lutea.AAC.2